MREIERRVCFSLIMTSPPKTDMKEDTGMKEDADIKTSISSDDFSEFGGIEGRKRLEKRLCVSIMNLLWIWNNLCLSRNLYQSMEDWPPHEYLGPDIYTQLREQAIRYWYIPYPWQHNTSIQVDRNNAAWLSVLEANANHLLTPLFMCQVRPVFVGWRMA